VRSSEASVVSRGELASAYRERALELARDVRHAGAIDSHGSGLRLRAEHDGWRLDALVARADGMIEKLAHHGAATDFGRGVLECACRALTGVTVTEAAEHGALRVELALSAPGAAPPVAGVVMPEHAGSAVVRLGRLLGLLAATYRAETGSADVENRFWPGPSARWVALDDAARLAAVNAVLAELFPDRSVVALSVEELVRVALDVAPSVERDGRPALLLRAEAELRRRIDPALCVERRARRDLNRIRRL
jgi:hypothetical protein